MPEVVPIEPQEADHATLIVVENCNDSLTTTVGFAGVIVNAEGVEPVRVTLWGLLVAESVNARTALFVPGADGLNITEAVQLDDAARDAPHVLPDRLNSPAFVPVMATELMLIAVAPPLFSVADWTVLLAPTATFA